MAVRQSKGGQNYFYASHMVFMKWGNFIKDSVHNNHNISNNIQLYYVTAAVFIYLFIEFRIAGLRGSVLL